jgi:hypothetical protein
MSEPTISDYRRAAAREREYLESLRGKYTDSFLRPIADRLREFESAILFYEHNGRLPIWAKNSFP